MAFDFGGNWRRFSDRVLTPERVAEAVADFRELLDGVPLRGGSFLDVGFGQGLSLLAAAHAGARVAGVDVNPTCRVVLESNRARFAADLDANGIPIVVGSILEDAVVDRLREISPSGGGFDVVHSWGVLHHTGDLWGGVGRAASLVRPGGTLVLAIYNRHWSCPLWSAVKRLYAILPALLRPALVWACIPAIAAATLLATRRNPFRKRRGMGFYHDVVDWVGGFPYAYAAPSEVRSRLASLGFEEIRFRPPPTPTGCNEFLFQRRG